MGGVVWAMSNAKQARHTRRRPPTLLAIEARNFMGIRVRWKARVLGGLFASIPRR